MARSQPILTPLTEAAIFLVLTIDEGREDEVRSLLEDLSGLRRSVGFRIPDGGLSVVTGIGSEMWDRLFDGPRPAELHPFVPLDGGRHRAPSTPGDLLFHLRASSTDLCFELAAKINDRLRGAATVVDETHGFRYFERRDLLGFVDGTENPEDEEAVAAALVGDEDPEFTGGSYVIVQKYLHDLSTWNAISVEEQERVIGRTKLDDIELDDATKPANSHVALTTIEDDDGEERQILRANMPFGSFGADEFGTYFIGYAATPDVTEEMLRNMFLGNPPGNYDRILDFSTAVTGSLFFCPSSEMLEDLPPAPADAPGTADTSASTPSDADGSLGIGALRRSSTL
ncbi:Dyp-type peroxidase [Rhodococcus sp. (in: high G+C Gram-positive bacteria)]|uniref:Dyp-type peroxidase n=1 Tax=unclassified Rhodococcus (in: high G+C Gram-positive bacteria) TaxID=192944 RepID=UPI0019D87DD4|nr:Dyp-type peroxidase [Rhodococcus sp. (in: high G+C Gram-positive bacteria)]MBF0663497.1 Dyp-type peroxidase [Rhodococcus sp. (in: high G+C Gram-positive bacteria)]